jgi:hypothetical protein
VNAVFFLLQRGGNESDRIHHRSKELLKEKCLVGGMLKPSHFIARTGTNRTGSRLHGGSTLCLYYTKKGEFHFARSI